MSFEDCEALGGRLVLVASKAFRALVLGVTDKVSDSETAAGALGTLHYCVLEVVARTQFDGMLQTELSKTLRTKPKDLFVVLRNLERRQLICRERSFLLSFSAAGVYTNRVWLTRFTDVSLHPWSIWIRLEREKTKLEEQNRLTTKTKRARKRREKVKKEKREIEHQREREIMKQNKNDNSDEDAGDIDDTANRLRLVTKQMNIIKTKQMNTIKTTQTKILHHKAKEKTKQQ